MNPISTKALQREPQNNEPTIQSVYSSSSRLSSKSIQMGGGGDGEDDQHHMHEITVDKIDLDFDMTKLIFDTIDVQFTKRIFLFQVALNLVPHAFLIVQFIIYPFTSYKITNWFAQGYTRTDFGNVLFNHIVPILVYVMVTCYWIAPNTPTIPNTQAIQDVLGGACWIPLCFYILHRVTVGVKYASLTKTEYDRFMSSETLEQVSTYQNQLQLLTSWANQRADALIRFEVAAAAARVGADIQDLYFIIPSPYKSRTFSNQFRRWQAFLSCQKTITGFTDEIAEDHSHAHGIPLCEVMIKQPDKSYKVSVFDVCKSTLMWVDMAPHGESRNTKITFLIALVNLVIPFFVLANHSIDIKDTTGCIIASVFYVTSTIINFLFYKLIFGFVSVALIDGSRRTYEVKILEDFLRVSDVGMEMKKTQKLMSSGMEKLSTKAKIQGLTHFPTPVTRRSSLEFAADINFPPTTTGGAPFRPSQQSAARPESIDLSRASSGTTMSMGEEFDENEMTRIPRMSMTFYGRNNILAWSYSRAIFKHFGDRFKIRIDIFLVLMTALIFFLLIIVIALALADLNSIKKGSITYQSPLTQQTMVASFLTIAFILLYIWTGAKINLDYQAHK